MNDPADTRHCTLDARGLLCPEPVRLAELRIRGLPAGGALRVRATDPAAALDFEVWCLRRGHRYLGCEQHDNELDIRVRKQGHPDEA